MATLPSDGARPEPLPNAGDVNAGTAGDAVVAASPKRGAAEAPTLRDDDVGLAADAADAAGATDAGVLAAGRAGVASAFTECREDEAADDTDLVDRRRLLRCCFGICAMATFTTAVECA